MTAPRRRFLELLGTAAIGGLAGCSSPTGPTTPGSTATPSETPTVTPTATLTTTQRPTTGTPGSPSTATTTTSATTPTTATATPTTTRTATPTPPPTTPTPTPTPEPPDPAQIAKLTARDGAAEDRFGAAVDLSADGTTALVGAFTHDGPRGRQSGSAYVFVREGDSWAQQAKLFAEDGGTGDYFGNSVALSGDGQTALLGASDDENPHGPLCGSAYVFARAGETWSQRAKLVAADGGPEDRFGTAVALSGDGETALVSAWNDENPYGDGGGSAYVFTREEETWAQRDKLVAGDGGPEDRFGASTALSNDGTVALVGASRDEDPNGANAGSAYLFSRDGDSWPQVTKLVPADGDAGDYFGTAAALSGDGAMALVGARADEHPNGERAGSAYVFARRSGRWAQRTKLVDEEGDALDRFGFDVALASDGTRALVGALYDEGPDGGGTGSAFLYSNGPDGWSQVAKLAADDQADGDNLGVSVALAGDGETALAGAWLDDRATEVSVGSAYVFSI